MEFRKLLLDDSLALLASKGGGSRSSDCGAFWPWGKDYFVGTVCDGVSSTFHSREASEACIHKIADGLKQGEWGLNPGPWLALLNDTTEWIFHKYSLRGLSTLSLLVVQISTGKFQILNVGDTSAYRLRSDGWFLLTEEDSVASISGKRQLTQAMGQEHIHVHRCGGTLLPSEKIAILTDGVSPRFMLQSRRDELSPLSLQTREEMEMVVEKSQKDSLDDATLMCFHFRENLLNTERN